MTGSCKPGLPMSVAWVNVRRLFLISLNPQPMRFNLVSVLVNVVLVVVVPTGGFGVGNGMR